MKIFDGMGRKGTLELREGEEQPPFFFLYRKGQRLEYDSVFDLLNSVSGKITNEIQNAIIKCWSKIHGYEISIYPKIMVSVSGGADSLMKEKSQYGTLKISIPITIRRMYQMVC